MKKMLLLAFVCLTSFSVFSQTDSASAHARLLLELTGSGKLGVQVMNNMMATYKKQLTTVPEGFWDEFSKMVNPSELIDMIVPIYTKYYSDAELVQIIQFYKTPLGQKITATLPLISQDSYTIGAEWGRKLGEKIVANLKAKGYIREN